MTPPEHFNDDERARWHRDREVDDFFRSLEGKQRRAAFDELRAVLDEAPRPRFAKAEDWPPIETAYRAWKRHLVRGELHEFRVEQGALRAGVVQGYEATPEALALDALERHRAHYHYITQGRGLRVAQERHADRQRRRTASEEAQVTSIASAVARRYRQQRAGLVNEFRPRLVIDERDERAWKAPEAA